MYTSPSAAAVSVFLRKCCLGLIGGLALLHYSFLCKCYNNESYDEKSIPTFCYVFGLALQTISLVTWPCGTQPVFSVFFSFCYTVLYFTFLYDSLYTLYRISLLSGSFKGKLIRQVYQEPLFRAAYSLAQTKQRKVVLFFGFT